MTMRHNGVEIELDFDGDGFPIVAISTGGSWVAENNRPAIDIMVNGVCVYEMFDEDDDQFARN